MEFFRAHREGERLSLILHLTAGQADSKIEFKTKEQVLTAMKRSGTLGRRKFYRIKATYLICYRVQLSAGIFSDFEYTLTKNISAGGMMVMTENRFEEGTPVEMIIRLPMYPEKKIDASGKVVSCEQTGSGQLLYRMRIKFVDFDKKAFDDLNDFILKEMQKYKDGIKLCQKLDRRKS